MFGCYIICCEDKASFGQLFSWIDFSSSETRGSKIPHLHSTTRSYYFRRWVDERETRGLWRANEGEKKRGFVCPPLCVRERERETVLPHTIDIKWEKAWNLACGSTWKKRNEGKWYRAWRKRRRWWRRWRKTTSTWASACGSQICWISARARTRKRQRWRIRLTFTCKGWRGWRKLRDERFYIEREIERNRNSETLETRRVQQREGYSCDVGNY